MVEGQETHFSGLLREKEKEEEDEGTEEERGKEERGGREWTRLRSRRALFPGGL